MSSKTQSKTSCSSGSCGSGGASNMALKIQDEMIKSSLGRIRHKLLVMSGKGGVGKSSLSAHLAVGLADRGYRVGLMDVDLHGPSIATILGLQGLLEITEDKFVIPKTFNEHLKVISMQSLMQEKDQSVIWRGPAKNGVIRQFLADVRWGDLDFLIIDSPPGTGDEPLSVIQTVPDAKGIIVTTPQEVALSDVRKSINFARIVNLDILGLVENMGPFSCPCCGKTVDLFKSGGGERTAAETGIPFLGTLPFDPEVVKACDAGSPVHAGDASDQFSGALTRILEKVLNGLKVSA